VFDWFGLLSLLGLGSVCVFLVVLAQLSRRLGKVTHAKSFYLGLFVSVGLVFVGIGARIANFTQELAQIEELNNNINWVLLYNGAPALGVTLAIVIVWRYWSWLLAERD